MTIALSAIEAATFAEIGALRMQAALGAAELQNLEEAVVHLPPDQAGIRLHGNAGIRRFLAPSGAVWKVAAAVLGETCHPVRAILFDKTVSTNWALAWHQDRTIAVAGRVEVAGFGPWTVKSGLLHVAPPFDLLAGMVTLRVHLDPVPATNAPLLIAPGSHRLGLIGEQDVKGVVEKCGTAVCLAEAGDIWLYATPILHSSEAASDPVHRRVLQVDFAVGDLPGGLRWLGV
ncbi:phytanoyl-CoA dioxygenase family protein [Bradyrhizobium sp. JYMT SZCCT0180]|uniref:phytanoyl-CoA dioxygenase family protein n=1 Tax=Bradyrhizobium sp. JYMT SZCCT0180 TaxID=2807666 RepID=UPI001BA4945A|nr:phytanoyl-CoA dioxygenase family protein [Bradyrhizobium sp. JYMT SZCCT0180]MBR1214528.1 phytanoyl-CoA dioxygenase family protein [Bradyrhizobium sp. JYMT SZCCT0180]